MIRRFEIEWHTQQLVEEPDGFYVKYGDAKAMLDTNAAVHKALLTEALEWTEGYEDLCRDDEQRRQLAEWKAKVREALD